jgi:Bacterial extracellular solute-binding proteins, family 3
MNFLKILGSCFQKLWAGVPIGSLSYLSLLVVTLAVLVPNQALAQTTRLERVLANKELRACIWPEYYSISYRNPKTRELSGIDIAITQDLARELGVKLKYVDSNFAQLYESLEQDRCDIATHAIGITEAVFSALSQKWFVCRHPEKQRGPSELGQLGSIRARDCSCCGDDHGSCHVKVFEKSQTA